MSPDSSATSLPMMPTIVDKSVCWPANSAMRYRRKRCLACGNGERGARPNRPRFLHLERQRAHVLEISLGTRHSLSDRRLYGTGRIQSHDCAGNGHHDAGRRSPRSGYVWLSQRPNLWMDPSSRVHPLFSRSVPGFGAGGRLHVPDLAPARAKNERPRSAAALGIAVSILLLGGDDPHSAGFHQQLWGAPVLAVLRTMVFLGH